MPNTAELLAEGVKLNAEIKERRTRLKEIDAELIKLGSWTRQECIVVGNWKGVAFPSDETAQAEVRKLTGKKLFPAVFTETTTIKPVKDCKKVIATLFKQPTADAIMALCGVNNPGFVQWRA